MKPALVVAMLGLAVWSPLHAASLHGVTLPDTEMVGQTELRLNGIALRTASIFFIPIYVAGLYLEHPDSNADDILRSPETKLLEIRFIHDVTAAQGRQAWQEGFEQNCVAPCRLPPDELERFLAAVRPMRDGDSFSILFAPEGAEITANGVLVGKIPDAAFATTVLATFIGPHPPTARLKRELLGRSS